MIVTPKIRNGLCMSAHPVGCAKGVQNEIDYIKSQGALDGPKRVLVLGCSTGYGLSSRITAGFGFGSDTIGVSFEKEGSERRPGTPGFYNNRAFDKAAKEAGIWSETLNGDAFSHEMRKKVGDLIKKQWGAVDLVIYSLASPVRTDPDTGDVYHSVIKPINQVFEANTFDFMTGKVTPAIIEAAEAGEIEPTIKVMGGEDWKLWMDYLKKEGLLSEGAKTVAYSYIGPEITKAVYRDGTIGQAKGHLEKTAKVISADLTDIKGSAFVSVNKALVTRSSSVIPVVPLYISLMYKIMKEKNCHEGCIEQIYRMMKDFLYNGGKVPLDTQGRIRLDNWEMREDVQSSIDGLWDKITDETVDELTDREGYRIDFLRLHGFGFDEIDYEKDVNLL